jgi:hypothetical protein
MSHPRYGLAWLTTILSRAQSRVTREEHMTTRQKTRRAPAAKAVTPEFASLPYDGTTADIRKMMARAERLSRPES